MLESPLEIKPLREVGRAPQTESAGNKHTVGSDDAEISVVGIKFAHCGKELLEAGGVIAAGLRKSAKAGQVAAGRLDQTVLARSDLLHGFERLFGDLGGAESPLLQVCVECQQQRRNGRQQNQ